MHQGEEIPLLIVGSWPCTCEEAHQKTERGSDSLAERPPFEPDLFLFFSSSPPSLSAPLPPLPLLSHAKS